MRRRDKIRILLLDDHHVVRKGLRLLFSTEESFDVLADFSCANDTYNFLKENEVDVVITDITMPEMNGIDFTKMVKTKFPEVKVLVLSMHLDAGYMVKVMDNGADGYILKDSKEEEIIEGVKTIFSGEMFMVKSVSDMLSKSLLLKSKTAKERTLTIREKEILKCIVDGLSNKMISAELSISERTVNAHRYNIMKKLKAKNSANLVRMSIEQNLL